MELSNRPVLDVPNLGDHVAELCNDALICLLNQLVWRVARLLNAA